MKNLQGYLLAASPRMRDAQFARTVILVVQHNERGAVGVVLNRPADATTREKWMQTVKAVVGQQAEVRIGGPVDGPVFALGKPSALAEGAMPPDLAAFGRHIASFLPAADYRVFLGCTPWEAGQLEEQVELGDWLLTPATAEHIFGDIEDLWRSVVYEVGESVLFELDINHFPIDPTLN